MQQHTTRQDEHRRSKGGVSTSAGVPHTRRRHAAEITLADGEASRLTRELSRPPEVALEEERRAKAERYAQQLLQAQHDVAAVQAIASRAMAGGAARAAGADTTATAMSATVAETSATAVLLDAQPATLASMPDGLQGWTCVMRSSYVVGVELLLGGQVVQGSLVCVVNLDRVHGGMPFPVLTPTCTYLACTPTNWLLLLICLDVLPMRYMCAMPWCAAALLQSIRSAWVPTACQSACPWTGSTACGPTTDQIAQSY